jgi:hypothetical protein
MPPMDLAYSALLEDLPGKPNGTTFFGLHLGER